MDAYSFEKILDQNKGIILHFCFIYTSNDDDQKDLFQEISYHIWKAFPSFNEESKVSTWIYKIAMRVALKFDKTERKRRLELNSFAQFRKKRHLNNDQVEDSILKLRACISSLNSVEKLIISMYLDELRYKDIGEIIGISENLVAVKIKRIKHKLSNCIKSKL